MFVGVGASACAICSNRPRKTRRALFSSMKLMRWGVIAARVLAAVMTSANKHSTSCLVEMDGFESNEGVIIDRRHQPPGRVGPCVVAPGPFRPSNRGAAARRQGPRENPESSHEKVPLANNVDAMVIARGTPGFSGADLANLVNEAALACRPARQTRGRMEELEDAKDKVMMGAERKSMVMTEEEKKLTAYHEAGHAIVAFMSRNPTRFTRRRSCPVDVRLGWSCDLPEGDRRVDVTRKTCKRILPYRWAGALAEEIIFGVAKKSPRARQAIFRMATNMARRMVTEWGMSDKLGPLRYTSDQEEVFLGHSVSQSKNLSDETASIVDSEMRRIVEKAYAVSGRIADRPHR
jgi:cell division protease FtsH